MDHLPLLIQQAPGADGFVFHGGKMNDDGTVRRARLPLEPGPHVQQALAVSVALTRTEPGDGGFCVVRGSHKSSLPCPPSIQRYEEHRDLVDNPGLEPATSLLHRGCDARDAAVVRGTHEARGAAVAPATSAYGRAYRPARWGGWTLTDAERAVLEPPYQRLDRPALTMGGEVAGQGARV